MIDEDVKIIISNKNDFELFQCQYRGFKFCREMLKEI